MKRTIVMTCLLAMPLALHAESAKDLLDPEQLAAAEQLLGQAPEPRFPAIPIAFIDLKEMCPDLWEKQIRPCTSGPALELPEAIRLVQSCLDKIVPSISKEAGIVTPRVVVQQGIFGCGRYSCSPYAANGIHVRADFKYQIPGSKEDAAQTPLWNLLSYRFGDHLLCYQSDVSLYKDLDAWLIQESGAR